jgi:2-C-methyl-D-erythritol 4-phosphate cytidylyltransferase
MNTLAIVIACGKEEEVVSGTEAGFLSLGDAPMLMMSLKTLDKAPSVDGIIVAVSKGRVEMVMHGIKRYGFSKVKGIVVGGVSRQSTLKTVFSKLPEPVSVVVVHEASRPFATQALFEETIKACKRYGCAIAAHKLHDAVKVAPKGLKATQTLERNSVWATETPQVFKYDVLKKILQNKDAKIIDDESEYVQKPAEVHLVESGSVNLKIRSTEDLAVATALLNARLA